MAFTANICSCHDIYLTSPKSDYFTNAELYVFDVLVGKDFEQSIN